MTYSARTRDQYRRGLLVLTGATTAAAVTAVGWLTGLAARDHEADLRAKEVARQRATQQAQADYARKRAAWLAAQPARVRTVWKKRPERTEVETRVVTGSTTIGSGGPLSSGSAASSTRSTGSSGSSGSSGSAGSGGLSGGSSGGSSGGGGGGHSAPAPPPPPPPAPVKSSGS